MMVKEKFTWLMSSLLLHTALFLLLLSAGTQEVFQRKTLFVRLLSPSVGIEKSSSENKGAVLQNKTHPHTVNKKEDFQKEKNQSKDLQEEYYEDNHHKNSTISMEGNNTSSHNLQNMISTHLQKGDESGLSMEGGTTAKETDSADGPSFLEMVKPLYPDLARRLGKEGLVLLKVQIDEHGRPLEIEVLQKAGFGFDESAVKAIKLSRFRPAMRRGIPIPSAVIIPVRFVLEK